MRYFLVIKVQNWRYSEANTPDMKVDNDVYMPLQDLENALKDADARNAALEHNSPYVYGIVSAASYFAAYHREIKS